MKIFLSPSLIGALLVQLVRLWRIFIRIERINAEAFNDPEFRAKRPVMVIWHDEIFALIAAHSHENMTTVVSQSKDGEILSQILERFGFKTARGSSSRGGLRALISALRQMDKTGSGAVLTVDGPRGPRHVAKPGALYLAQKAGSPIMPVRAICSRKYVFHKAWDKFQLPLPFSTCTIIYGKPIYFPPCSTDAEMEEQCREIERLLEHLEIS